MTHLKISGLASLCLALVVAAEALSSPAVSEEQARQAIEARKQVFKDMESAFKPVGAMLKKPREPFDAAVVQTSAERIEELSGKIPELFQLDTSKFAIETAGTMPDGRYQCQMLV